MVDRVADRHLQSGDAGDVGAAAVVGVHEFQLAFVAGGWPGPVEVGFHVADAERWGGRRRREHHVTPILRRPGLWPGLQHQIHGGHAGVDLPREPQRVGQQLQPAGDLGRCRLLGEDGHLVRPGAHAVNQRDHHSPLVVAVDPGPGAQPVRVGILAGTVQAPSPATARATKSMPSVSCAATSPGRGG